MAVDQIPRTYRREWQATKVLSNHLANAYGTCDSHGQRSVLSWLVAECRIVFFQLHIGCALFAQPNLYTALNNLGPETI
jgi:hypothetical protein